MLRGLWHGCTRDASVGPYSPSLQRLRQCCVGHIATQPDCRLLLRTLLRHVHTQVCSSTKASTMNWVAKFCYLPFGNPPFACTRGWSLIVQFFRCSSAGACQFGAQRDAGILIFFILRVGGMRWGYYFLYFASGWIFFQHSRRCVRFTNSVHVFAFDMVHVHATPMFSPAADRAEKTHTHPPLKPLWLLGSCLSEVQTSTKATKTFWRKN